MLNFKKDRLILLKALKGLVDEELDAGKINPVFEEDVSNYISEVTDKKRNRRLKSIRRELDSWILEAIQYRKLKEEERKFNEVKVK